MVRGLLAAVLGGEDYGTKDSERKHRGYWRNPKSIVGHFYDSLDQLKRVPNALEINGGARVGIKEEVILGIRTYNQFLKYLGFDLNRDKWPHEKINNHFYDTLNKLRRVPSHKEINGAAFSAIEKGRYDSGIHSYNEFLRYHGFEVNHDIGKWTKKRINEHLYDLTNKLKRVPTMEEFNGSALLAIRKGLVIGVKTYNQFIKYHGFKTRYIDWKPLSDRHMLEIGRQMNYDLMARSKLQKSESVYYNQLYKRNLVDQLIPKNKKAPKPSLLAEVLGA